MDVLFDALVVVVHQQARAGQVLRVFIVLLRPLRSITPTFLSFSIS